jgi:ferric-dicitrate binding protein FerR (iron transport regulator)
MPTPTTERQALERERAELPAHVANYQRELDATPPENRERRERLAWQIRRVEKRMAEVHARLMALVLIAVSILVGCSGVPVPPTYTQEELKAECDRHRGWWRPDDLRGGYCDFRGP